MAFTDQTFMGHEGLVYTGTVGSDNPVGEFQEWAFTKTRPKVRKTAMGDTRESYHLGLPDGSFTGKANFNAADTGQTALLAAFASGTAVTVTLYFEGTATTAGDHWTGDVKITDVTVSGPIDGLLSVDFSGTLASDMVLTAGV